VFLPPGWREVDLAFMPAADLAARDTVIEPACLRHGHPADYAKEPPIARDLDAVLETSARRAYTRGP
jgi:hypothetical protein